MKHLIWVFILIQAGYGYTQDTNAFSYDLDSAIRLVLEDAEFVPGASISVIKGSEVIVSRGYGVQDIGSRQPTNEETLFYIASSTKSFTGFLAAVLDSKGLVPLSSTLTDLFPSITWPDSIQVDDITVRHLLSHTSGLYNGPLTFTLAYSGIYDTEDQIDLLKHTENGERPLGEYHYDNLGYNIYTLGLYDKYGIDWKDALKEHVFDPLDMQSSFTTISEIQNEPHSVSVPHIALYKGQTETILSPMTKSDQTLQSAGGVYTNTHDLTKWLKFLVNPEEVNDTHLFSAYQEMLKPIALDADTSFIAMSKTSYALGWQKTLDNLNIYLHQGRFPGFESVISFSKKYDIGVAIVTNESYQGSSVTFPLHRFVYSWWSEGRDAAFESLSEHRKKFSQDWKLLSDQLNMHFNERTKRKWKVDFNLNYDGVYRHEHYGDIVVKQKERGFEVTYGNLKDQPEPFPHRHAIRLEFIPNKGVPALFVVDKSKRVTGLRYKQRLYEKVDSTIQ